MRIPRCSAANFAWIAWIATSAGAQDSTAVDSVRSNARMLGGAILVPQLSGGGAGEFTAVAFTVSPARVHRLGPDFAFVLVPRGLTSGVVFGGVRANVGLPLRVAANVLLVPSAGMSFVGGVGGVGAVGTTGVNGTLAIIVHSDQGYATGARTGLRAAISVHRFGDDTGGALRVLEIGIVRWRR